MTEDQKLARELVERDARNMGRAWRADGLPFNAFVYEELPATNITERTFVVLTIGTRDQLTKREARRAAQVWRTVRAKSPKSPVCLHFLGYDDDPRELYEFPDVRRYVRWWARAAGLDDFDTAAQEVADQKRFPALLGILAGCGVFGPEMAAQVTSLFPPQQAQ